MSPKSVTFSYGSGASANPPITAPVRWLNRDPCHVHRSELPESSTGPPVCVQTGLSAIKFVSSIRVTSTAVVTPFLGKVAAVVAPIARSALVKFMPATISAFASAGGAVGEGVGVGVAVAFLQIAHAQHFYPYRDCVQ